MKTRMNTVELSVLQHIALYRQLKYCHQILGVNKNPASTTSPK